jgi:hypothetical protein
MKPLDIRLGMLSYATIYQLGIEFEDRTEWIVEEAFSRIDQIKRIEGELYMNLKYTER